MAAKVTPSVAVQISANLVQFQATLNKASGAINGFANQLKNIQSTLIGAFAMERVITGVIDVTSQFEKLEAVLTNTLGSNSLAQKALDNIKDFARTSPYEVSEITNAYVRWASMGLDPTIDRMKKLGDVASALGAGFEQTAEAFKDLAVGQTKRIEEIGILATQENGKIQLSFRGLNLEIEKNVEGVQKALEVYSTMSGVMGSSDAIAKTLGGRVSNLKDAWDMFLLTLGKGNSGILYGTVTSMTNLLNAFSHLKEEIELLLQASPTVFGFFFDLKDVSEDTLDYLLNFGRTSKGNKISDVLSEIFQQGNVDFIKNQTANYIKFVKVLEAEGESVDEITVLWDRYLTKRQDAYITEVNASNAAAAAAAKRKEAEVAAAKATEDAYYAQFKILKQIKDLNKDQKIGKIEIPKIDDSVINSLSKFRKEFQLFSLEMVPVKDTFFKNELDLVALKAMFAGQGLRAYLDALKALAEQGYIWGEQVSETAEKIKNALSEGTMNIVRNFFSAFEQIGAKELTFGQNIIAAISDFMKLFGEQLVALGLAKLGFDKLLANLTIPNPGVAIAAIAAGTALITLAGSIKAKNNLAIQKNVRTTDDSSVSSKIRGMDSIRLEVTGRLTGQGKDLIAVIDNANFDNRFRKGG